MIHYIIYSKNRAAQLDLLLQSIDHWQCPIEVSIIWKATSSKFQCGYNEIFLNHNYQCVRDICEEQDFKQDGINLLSQTNTPLIGFLTDDTVFYRPIMQSADFLNKLLLTKKCNSFSLRNGYNTQDQCHFNKQFMKLKSCWETDTFVMWDTSQYSYGCDFGRPISIDGNFFRRDVMMPMLLNKNWNDPRSLDGINPDPLGKHMMAFKHSIVVNIPVNLTCDGYANNWGRFKTYTLEELNNGILEGRRLNLNKMDFSNMWSSHLELELYWNDAELPPA